MRIALSTDHAGFEQLKSLQEFLTAKGYECVNYGPKEFDADDDYPDFIFPAAKAVATGECEFGIIMGGSGQGEAIAANRVKGIRCMTYYGAVLPVGAIDAGGGEASDEYEILRLSKQHNNANMISIGARFVSQEEIEKAVEVWLDETFSGVERHARRIKKLDTGQ
ncbi:MAG TPA: RpiB/LacA/LacB family sugar-phosphate isomerase [Patescibacteria group bacterium]|nr:RpiB/LacA/LacB family sugar-phosphate isomerase [Patescibacteria group bacterium]